MSYRVLLPFLPILMAVFLYLRKYSQGGQFTKRNLMITDKVVIVTGCNSGIGKETVLDLAKRGARIYMACRDARLCEIARLDIIEQSGNTNVFNRKLDLASINSIRQFAKNFISEESRLDILINNAGVMNVYPRTVTSDGFEMTFGVNHLGHFLLTNLLLDVLRKSSPSRIVNVSSRAHYYGSINRDDIMSNKYYHKWSAYCQSKLANVLFTRQLALLLQGTGVTANSLHPGVVKTELFRHQNILRYIYYLGYPFFKTARAGAQTTLMVALDDKLITTTGKYFSDCHIVKEARNAKDDFTAEWLWKSSEKLTGLLPISFIDEKTKC